MAPFLEPADKIAKSLRHNDGLSLLLDFGTAAVSLRRLFRFLLAMWGPLLEGLYIWPKDRKMQFLPGLFQIIESIGPAGEKRQSFSFGMLTRTANELMANIHNDGEFRHRMPLFLTPKLEEFWLSEHFTDADMKAVCEYLLPSDALDYRAVFSIRGSEPRPDGKPKFELWRYENSPPLGDDNPFKQFTLFQNSERHKTIRMKQFAVK